MQHMLAAMYRVRYDSGIESNGKESGWVRLGVVGSSGWIVLSLHGI